MGTHHAAARRAARARVRTVAVAERDASTDPQALAAALSTELAAVRRRRRRGWTVTALVAVVLVVGGVGVAWAWATRRTVTEPEPIASASVVAAPTAVVAGAGLQEGDDACRTVDRSTNPRFDPTKYPTSTFNDAAVSTDKESGEPTPYNDPLGISVITGDGLDGRWDNCSTKQLSWDGQVYTTAEKSFVGQRVMSPGDWIQRTLEVENKTCSGTVTVYLDMDNYLGTEAYQTMGAWQDGYTPRVGTEQGLNLPEHVELMWGLGGVEACLAPWQADPLLSESSAIWATAPGPLAEHASTTRYLDSASVEAAGQWPAIAKDLLAEPASTPTAMRCSSYLQPLADEALRLANEGALIPAELTPEYAPEGMVPIAQAYVAQGATLPITMGERMDVALDHHHEKEERSVLAFDIYLTLDCDLGGNDGNNNTLPITGGIGAKWLLALAALIAIFGLIAVLRRRANPTPTELS